jgi:hypothetical protein
MYMEEICIIQIQRPSRAGALGPIFIKGIPDTTEFAHDARIIL